jgi:hypothetical protein
VHTYLKAQIAAMPEKENEDRAPLAQIERTTLRSSLGRELETRTPQRRGDGPALVQHLNERSFKRQHSSQLGGPAHGN